MNVGELRDLITGAFRAVTLAGGLSIRQGEVCDNWGKDNRGREVSEAKFASIPREEITDDWTALPLAELERCPYLTYLDAAGFRYYIPAFMLSLLEDASGASTRASSTLSSLYPKRDSWLHDMRLYELLSGEQRSAIALFLQEVQGSARFSTENQTVASRALRNYWQQFLPRQHAINVA